ncbi:uncharacterized protein [Zea mays]|uniref:uncharacterized protein n=1 Tax=Zea mays TaxID=4577 RepID=UPI0004DE7FAE|nr:uncharacterized protein LOC103655133 [Zea mays]|eukprot:XP_008680157.1 uncharacterized protein LOC103655133 [Zea mays]
MGDHLALIVGRLLTESMLDAAIGGGKQMVDLRQETVDVEYCHRGLGGGSATKAGPQGGCRSRAPSRTSSEVVCCCSKEGRRGSSDKVAKTTWRDVSYQITKINMYKDGRHVQDMLKVKHHYDIAEMVQSVTMLVVLLRWLE